MVEYEVKVFWTNIFCKSLYGFLILKVIFILPVTANLVYFYPLNIDSTLSSILYAPLLLFQLSNNLFFGLFLVLLVGSLFLKLNYVAAFFIFWFSFSLSRLTLPINNGSDSVLNLFLLIAILLPTNPGFISSKWHQRASTGAHLFARLALSLIYFTSGYDKLTSVAWRSGAAIHSVTNLTFHANPFLLLNLSEFQFLAISWLIISFELGFSILIWFNKFRIPLLVMGVLFHLSIVFFLGLADFGIVMILCYAVFLPLKKTKQNKNLSFSAN